jgi:hypothetical protein
MKKKMKKRMNETKGKKNKKGSIKPALFKKAPAYNRIQSPNNQ